MIESRLSSLFGRIAKQKRGGSFGTGLCLALITFLAWAMPASAQGDCLPVRFASGSSSIEVSGQAPPEGNVCFSVATGANQQAAVELVAGNNVYFSIDGLTDAVDQYRFTTKKTTYRIRVGQLFRSVTDESFRLRIAVTGGAS